MKIILVHLSVNVSIGSLDQGVTYSNQQVSESYMLIQDSVLQEQMAHIKSIWKNNVY